ncbi:DUF6412 domain-containing protein, partial [Streptomyces koyangensis]
TAIRDRARRTAFLPQRDPDAPGRRRPHGGGPRRGQRGGRAGTRTFSLRRPAT